MQKQREWLFFGQIVSKDSVGPNSNDWYLQPPPPVQRHPQAIMGDFFQWTHLTDVDFDPLRSLCRSIFCLHSKAEQMLKSDNRLFRLGWSIFDEKMFNQGGLSKFLTIKMEPEDRIRRKTIIERFCSSYPFLWINILWKNYLDCVLCGKKFFNSWKSLKSWCCSTKFRSNLWLIQTKK